MLGRVRALFIVLASAQAGCHAATSGLDGGTDGGMDGAIPVWVPEPGIPEAVDFFTVWGRARTDIFIGGWNGTILHYDGTGWTKQTLTATVPIESIHGWLSGDPAIPNGPTFAVGWRGRLFSYDNTSWSDLSMTTTATEDLYGVRVGTQKNALAIGDHGRMLGYDGTTWKIVHLRVPGDFSGRLIEPQTVLKGIFNEGDHYYFTGSGGAAYRSSGGFRSFEALDTRVNQALRGVWGPNGGPVYAVGLDGLILRFQNGVWRRITDNGADMLPKQFFFGIDGMSSDDITIVGWAGTAVRFTGGQWITEETGTTADLRSVWIDPTTQVAFAVGANGTVLRRDVPDAGMADGAVSGDM